MDYPIIPFEHNIVNDAYNKRYCIFCSCRYEDKLQGLCLGGWYKRCMKSPHFHHVCRMCSGEFLILPYEINSTEQIRALAHYIVKMYESNGITDEIKNDVIFQVTDD